MKRISKIKLYHAATIMVLILVAYLGTLNVPFYFDDHTVITDYKYVHDLSYFSNPAEVQEKGSSNFWMRYFGYLSFALNYHFHGLDVPGYHMVNIAVHILSALIVYWLVLLTLRTPALERSSLRQHAPWVALTAALLFALHPVQTQAITYITQRMASMAALFYALAIAAYASARFSDDKRQRIALYALCLVSTFIAMKTKQNAITVPLAIGLYEMMFFRGGWKKRILWLAPVMLTLAVIPVTYLLLPVLSGTADISVQKTAAVAERVTSVAALSRTTYLLTEFRVLVTYIRLLVLPMNLSLLYDYPAYTSLAAGPVAVSFMTLTGLFLLGVYLLRRSGRGEPALKVIVFGIFFFFISLSVESTLVPLNPIYEHRLYLPLLGIAPAAATVLMLALMRLVRFRKLAIAALLVLTVLFTAGAIHRNRAWKDPVILWKDTALKAPDAIIAHNNLANLYSAQGRHQEAIDAYTRALNATPPQYMKNLNTYLSSLNYNIAHEYAMLGLPARAIEYYRKATDLDPKNADAHSNLGLIYFNMGMMDQAEELYRTAMKYNSRHMAAHVNLAEVLLMKGETDRAVNLLLTALQMNPGLIETHRLLAEAYMAKGMKDEANRHLLQIQQLSRQGR